MKSYLYAAIALAVIAGLSTSHYMVYDAGKQAVVSKIQGDRITILQGGKRIDDKVLTADDDALLCMLIECVSDK